MSYVSTDIKKIIAEIIENKKEKGGVKNIYFVGCGGSLGALYPAKTFMEREAQVLRSAWINSNEFVHSTPKDFGENSIICLACHKGNTPETIQAAKLGKEKGAAVIILTWLEESEIIEFGDYIISNRIKKKFVKEKSFFLIQTGIKQEVQMNFSTISSLI